MRKRYPVLVLLSAAMLLTGLAIPTPPALPATTQGWPMYGADSGHTGRSAAIGPSTANLVWQLTGPGRASENGSPVVGPDGTIYLPGAIALNPNGSVKWTANLASFWTAPAVGVDGNAYFVSQGFQDQFLYSLKANDGSTVWKYPIGHTTYGSPTVGPDGTIYVGAGQPDGRVYAINPDGTLRWRWNSGTGCWVESSPAIGPSGDVYVNHNCLGLVALDSAGNRKWNRDGGLGQAFNSPSVGADGTIYLGSSPDFSAVNPDGSLKWTASTDNWMYSASSAISSDGSTIYRGDNGGIFYAFDRSGSLRWRYNTGIDGIISSAPALAANGIVYFTEDWSSAVRDTDRGYLYAVRAADGHLLWKYDIGWSSASPAIAADGNLYALGSTYEAGGNFPGNQGILYAFRCADGVCDVTPPPKTLSVGKAGTGRGTITSSPSGIDCGSTCSHDFPEGASVTLTASAQSGSNFSGWGGDCSGTRICTLTMSADRSVTATFTIIECVVPNVKGKLLGAAQSAIVDADCRTGTIRRAFSSRVRKGHVISQTPAPGTKLPEGGTVNLVVSKGRRPTG